MLKQFIQKCLANKIIWFYIIGGGMAIAAILISLVTSSVNVSTSHIALIIIEKVTGWGDWIADMRPHADAIIWEIRLPRVLLAFLVGAALSLSGAAFQGLLRNPLADPYTIGVSSGAALGAVIVIFFNIAIVGVLTLPLFAVVGGFVALLVVFTMTRLSGRGLAVETIILAGIIVSSFIGAFISLIIALSGEELHQIIYWLMGNLAGRGWTYVYVLIPFFIIGSVLLLIHFRELNALAFGEESARHLGVDVDKRKGFILAGASLLTGAAVAVSGMIGFVGLVIPHLVRLVTGPNHLHVLFLSMFAGGAFLVGADMIARTIIAPSQLPIGVITALIGAPVFALLLMKQKAGRGLQS